MEIKIETTQVPRRSLAAVEKKKGRSGRGRRVAPKGCAESWPVVAALCS